MVKKAYPADAWEYTDWLYCSGRLTAEEHTKLKQFLLKVVDETVARVSNEGC